METILLVEDDENLGKSLQRYFQDEGYSVEWAKEIKEAREKVKKGYSIVVLDWVLPDGHGIDLLKEMRKQDRLTPVIMLTARTELIDKVLGLESGANDYMTKPFEPRELLARVRAQLRQKEISKQADEAILEVGPLRFVLEMREVYFKEKLVELTKMEYEFLKLLAEYPNRVFSREEILNKVWGYEHYPTTRTVDTHVLQLRQKFSEELIETIRGVGYRLRTP